jgi:hypothetical protein
VSDAADVAEANVRFYRAFTAILATNLFERDATGWRLVRHHVSHVL